jgi:hypothetical protein
MTVKQAVYGLMKPLKNTHKMTQTKQSQLNMQNHPILNKPMSVIS